MRESLKLLIELQELDLIIDGERKKQQEIPEKIKKLQEEYNKDLEKLEEYKKGSSRLQVEKKNKEIELESREETIKKYQKELNAIKSNEAYKAMLKQIEDANREKSTLEDEILEMMQKSEDLQRECERKKAQTLESKETMDKEIGDLNEKSKQLSIELEALGKRRGSYIGEIPQETLKRYENIKDNKGGLAVVNIDGNSCGGCHINVTPQLISEAMRDEELVICENCGRIIYWKG